MILHKKMFSLAKLLYNLSINFIADFCPHFGSFCCLSHNVSAKFHLWPSSGNKPRPRIGMLSLVTVSPVIAAIDNNYGQQ